MAAHWAWEHEHHQHEYGPCQYEDGTYHKRTRLSDGSIEREAHEWICEQNVETDTMYRFESYWNWSRTVTTHRCTICQYEVSDDPEWGVTSS